MAMGTTKSSLLAKLGGALNAAVQQAAVQPYDPGRQGLPGGIKDGVAKLHAIEFGEVEAGKQNAGQLYWRMAGIVCEPNSIIKDGVEVPIAGKQTSIFGMLCETKTKAGKVTTAAESVNILVNEMKGLGGDDCCKNVKTVLDLDVLAKQLVAAKPAFWFSTSEGKATPEYPEPKVFENWHGGKGLEDYVAPLPGGTVDNSVAVTAQPSTNGSSGVSTPAKGINRIGANAFASRQPVPEPSQSASNFTADQDQQTAPAAGGEDDLDALAAAAQVELETNNNPNSQEAVALLKMAEELGVKEQFDDAPSFTEGVEIIKAALSSQGDSDDAGTAGPVLGGTYRYQQVGKDGKPLHNAKTKKPQPPTDVEVTLVDEANQTCNIKQVGNAKVNWKDVPWDKLS